MHLNGGRDFSQMNYEVLRDGKLTDVMRITRTDGSPQYLKTVDKFVCETSEFDILASRVGMMDWLKQHAQPKAD